VSTKPEIPKVKCPSCGHEFKIFWAKAKAIYWAFVRRKAYTSKTRKLSPEKAREMQRASVATKKK
jgi:hypothetical protein